MTNTQPPPSLLDVLRVARPNVSQSTIASYVSIINKLHALYKEAHATETALLSGMWLTNMEGVQALVEQRYKPTTAKNVYNAATVFLMAIAAPDGWQAPLAEQYAKLRDEAHGQYEKLVQSHQKTDKQEENWVSMGEITTLLKSMRAQAHALMKNQPRARGFSTIQDYILLLTYSKTPMRNDVANMRVLTPTHPPFSHRPPEFA